jgi:hypothetical protein
MTVSAYHQAGVQNDWVIIWQTRVIRQEFNSPAMEKQPRSP